MIVDPNPEGPAIESVIKFIKSDASFIKSYVEAWGIATNNGFSGLNAIGSG